MINLARIFKANPYKKVFFFLILDTLVFGWK